MDRMMHLEAIKNSTNAEKDSSDFSLAAGMPSYKAKRKIRLRLENVRRENPARYSLAWLMSESMGPKPPNPPKRGSEKHSKKG